MTVDLLYIGPFKELYPELSPVKAIKVGGEVVIFHPNFIASPESETQNISGLGSVTVRFEPQRNWKNYMES